MDEETKKILQKYDALIKNFRTELYEHPALADRFDFAEDAKSATFRLRPNVSAHPSQLERSRETGADRPAACRAAARNRVAAH